MDFQQVIQIGGTAICLWELAKIAIDYKTPAKQEAIRLREEETAAIQEEIFRHIKTVITPRTSESEYNFYAFLVKNYYFRPFTINEVAPKDWTLQKTTAILTHLYQNNILRRYVERGKMHYEFPLDKWQNLW